MSERIACVSCTKAKRAVPSAARDLYVSPLFRGLRAYAESHADRWYILSAKYGVLRPEQVVEPYERTLNKMSKVERLSWWHDVKRELIEIVPEGSDVVLLAGSRYRENIEPFLRERGCRVQIPLEGLTFGRQLAWLKAANATDAK
jgi:cytoplasmic iron level regulating protein YaaA (DUF328/UPF0246 family)